MSTSSSSQGLYSPLRQHISDSESEEDVQSCKKIGQNKVVLIESYNNNCSRLMNGNSKAYQHFDSKVRASNREECAMGDRVYMRSVDSNSDNVSILQSEANVNEPKMSAVRKVMFLSSILLCFLTVVVFLWVIPCGEKGECRSGLTMGGNGGVSSWENSYQDMELKGAVSVVNGAIGKDKNMIMLFRGDVINAGHAEGGRESSDNGIVQLVGTTGKVGWFITQPRLPTDIDCTLLDVNRDGNKDCIVIGEHGLFAALDPTVGTVFWYLHNHPGTSPQQAITSVDFPLVLLDLDGDGVNDLLGVCSVEKDDSHLQNSLILVSGYSGDIIGEPLMISQCTSINKLQIDENHMVSYTCRNNTTLAESLKVTSLEDLYKAITNKPFKAEWETWLVGKQHALVGQRREIVNQRNVYSIDGRKLVVENEGHCPKNCKVSVQLIDERSGKENISWQYIAPQVYGMVPATLLFNNSANNSMLKHHISGFVLKFWQWNTNYRNSNRFDRNADLNFNIFNNVDLKTVNTTLPNDHHMRRIIRNTNSTPTVRINGNITANRLTERVVLVTFNATDFHIVNASQSDVFQICLPNKELCQPDLTHQENSLLIADIDGDGSQELITYLSSFLCPDFNSFEELPHENIKCNEEWKLHSTVRVVRLEAELPKLYEAVSHH